MKIIRPDRADWLRLVHGLHVRFRRSPIPTEISAALGVTIGATLRRINAAIEDGQVAPGAGASGLVRIVRLTPEAMCELGIPMVVYLATSNHEASCEVERWLGGLGVVPVRICTSGPETRRSDAARMAALALACRSDAVIALTDPLLVGRDDVSAALDNGALVSLIQPGDDAQIRSAAELWRPPYLVTRSGDVFTGISRIR